MSDRTSSTIVRPGAELFCEEFGTGPLLGYSHGVFFSNRVEDAIGLLDWSGLAGERRIVRYHQRGHGLSTGEPDPESYSWPNLAADLLAVADEKGADEKGAHEKDADAKSADEKGAEEKGADPIDWAGSSLGAGALLWAAVQNPTRFRRLILMIPPTIRDTRTATRRAYLSGATGIEARGKDSWLRIMRDSPIPAIFADVPGYEFQADIPEILLPAVLRGAASTDVPHDDALRAITQPVLILARETDARHPVSSAELLAKVLSDARLHVSGTSSDVRKWPVLIGDFLRG